MRPAVRPAMRQRMKQGMAKKPPIVWDEAGDGEETPYCLGQENPDGRDIARLARHQKEGELKRPL